MELRCCSFIIVDHLLLHQCLHFQSYLTRAPRTLSLLDGISVFVHLKEFVNLDSRKMYSFFPKFISDRIGFKSLIYRATIRFLLYLTENVCRYIICCFLLYVTENVSFYCMLSVLLRFIFQSYVLLYHHVWME